MNYFLRSPTNSLSRAVLFTYGITCLFDNESCHTSLGSREYNGNEIHSYQTRNDNNIYQSCYHANKSKNGSSVISIKLFNVLPSGIKNGLETFKTEIKFYLICKCCCSTNDVFNKKF